MATLQKQGVPIPDKLTGPQAGSANGPNTRTATPSRANRGSAPQRATRSTSKSVSNRQSRSASVSDTNSGPNVNPVSAGKDIGSGAGLLEAEFLTALGLLVLLMFSSDADLIDKMMSIMKRGTLICAVFFILA